MIKTSAKGDRLAYKVKDYFVERGFVVVKGAGSKSYPKGSGVDMIAFNSVMCYIIQLKNTHLSDKARLKLHDGLVKHQGYKFAKPLILSANWKEEIEAV